jgi:hypothetical protein
MQTTSNGYPVVQLTSSLLLQSPVSASSFQILQAIDDPVAKTVNALVQVGPKGSNNWYYVWSGASYEAIGDWTDEELAAAVQYQVVQQYPLNPYTT